MAETVYQDNDLQIGPEAIRTSTGRVLDPRSVVAVEVETVPANRAAGVAVAVVGVLAGAVCAGTAQDAAFVGVVFGVVAVTVGVAMTLRAHDRRVVRVALADGTRRLVLGTPEEGRAEEVAAALRQVAGLGD